VRTTVLGLGNVLLSDEGVGVRVVEAAEARLGPLEGVSFLDGGTSTMELLDQLVGVDALVVVDALRGEEPPGTIVRLEGAELVAFFQRTRLSPHQLGLSDLLAALELLDARPRKLVLIGIVPASLEHGIELTPAVAAAVVPALRLLEAELDRLGYHPALAA
jgi:hydrogenase maturation protease